MKTKPRLFIGSSTEALQVAQCVQAELEDCVEATVWNQGIVAPGITLIDALTSEARGCDFAVLVAQGDQLSMARGITWSGPRDNILFELGLFIGYIGLSRTFILLDREGEATLPSDLSGVACLRFGRRQDGNLRAAVGPACTQVRKRVSDLGPRPLRSVKQGLVDGVHKAGLMDIYVGLAEQATAMSLSRVVDEARFGSRVTCIGRSFINLLRQETALLAGLRKGLQFRLACWDPTPGRVSEETQHFVGCSPMDTGAALKSLRALLVRMAAQEKAPGLVEIRYHTFCFSDSPLLFETNDGDMVLWTLSFGSDEEKKLSFLLRQASGTLGGNLAEQTHKRWSDCEQRFLFQAGELLLDNLY